jgi:hypothetical protein
MKKIYFVVCFILLISCRSSQKVINFSLSNKYVSLNKVKVKIGLKAFESLTLRGNISIVEDSLICFGFWGPLGLKVISGHYDDKFRIVDHYNGNDFPDVISKLSNTSGIVFNRKIVEEILRAELDSLSVSLTELNKEMLQIGYELKGSKKNFSIVNKIRKSELNLEYSFKQSLLKSIKLSYKDSFESWNVIIEIIDITNEKKKCNFG